MPRHKISGSDEMKCIKDNCKKPVRVKSRQLCNSHYQTWRRQYLRANPTKTCGLEDCGDAYYAKGFCQNHYAKWLRYGTPERPVRMCACGKKAICNGMCKACHSLNYYYNEKIRPMQTTNANYKGDNVGYAAVHQRIRRTRGRAHDHTCVQCGNQAESWALKHTAENLRFGYARSKDKKASAYSLDLDDYQPMCNPCHRAYDAEHKNRSYKLKESRWAS